MIVIFIIYLLLMAMHAYSEAHDDDLKIAAGQEIDHGAALLDRILTGLLISAVVIAFETHERGLWHGMLLLPIGWAWWTMLFRFSINRMRGLDWRYLGHRLVARSRNDSAYDTFFHIVAQRLTELAQRLLERPRKRRIWIAPTERAGAIAYAFEASVFIASTVTYFLTSSLPG